MARTPYDVPLGTITGRIKCAKSPFKCAWDEHEAAEERATSYRVIAQLHPHNGCPYCNGTLAFAKGAVSDTELVEWFVREGWRQSKQELVAKLRKDFNVTKK